MKLRPLPIEGSYEILSEPITDERGFFGRTLDLDVLRATGLRERFEQENLSWNARRGTLRGMHFQAEPEWETKIVTCVAGRIFDVVLDLRRSSPTFGRWEARNLAASDCNSLYIPEGCAHGFQTLEPNCTVLYRITPSYHSDLARGVHPFDDEIAIRWPIPEAIASRHDLSLPGLREVQGRL
ncbi:MAG: dTDP-4-dehydrorhamnose 3,5-epimerase family protein [Candidatus Tyrphobacter sp.]